MSNKDFTTICDKCYRKTWYEDEQQCHCSYLETKTCNECGHTETLDNAKEVRCTGTLRKIDNSELDSRFTPYYERGERVEVIYKDGLKERFYIGKSTGWKPVYLTLARADSIGGGALLSDSITHVRGLSKYL
jgi:hypothetical protein